MPLGATRLEFLKSGKMHEDHSIGMMEGISIMAPESNVKRPPNAFILYCLENRQEMRSRHPELPNVEVTKMLGDNWKALDEISRRPYKERAKNLQAEFKRSNPEYKYVKARQRRTTQEMLLRQNSQQYGSDNSMNLAHRTAMQLLQTLQVFQSLTQANSGHQNSQSQQMLNPPTSSVDPQMPYMFD